LLPTGKNEGLRECATPFLTSRTACTFSSA
jgi:hypothetical protein